VTARDGAAGAAAGYALARPVTTLADLERAGIERLLGNYGLVLEVIALGARIPGSYWGDSEAGLERNRLYARLDTPAHSLLHELGHYVCMDDVRRAGVDTDAGGDDDEEGAVCYLQTILAARLPGFSGERCLQDMDAWGYSFREGSARRWLDGDARFARAWLLNRGIIDAAGAPTWQMCR
jgi:hypothetical protein